MWCSTSRNCVRRFQNSCSHSLKQNLGTKFLVRVKDVIRGVLKVAEFIFDFLLGPILSHRKLLNHTSFLSYHSLIISVIIFQLQKSANSEQMFALREALREYKCNGCVNKFIESTAKALFWSGNPVLRALFKGIVEFSNYCFGYGQTGSCLIV